MVGDSAQRRERAPMVALYKKIFPVILQLACQTESVAKQLFEPLVRMRVFFGFCIFSPFYNTFAADATCALVHKQHPI
jgi:hypothetical protein